MNKLGKQMKHRICRYCGQPLDDPDPKVTIHHDCWEKQDDKPQIHAGVEKEEETE